MPRNPRAVVYRRTLWDDRRVLTAWAVATGLLALAYASFYPQLAGGAVPNVPSALEGFGLAGVNSAAAYLQGAVFGLLVPLLITFYGAATGARAISGDEESGYLDLLLAHPLGRTRLLLQRFAALATGAVLITAVVWAALLAVRGPAELTSVTVGGFTAQAVHLALLGILFGALATGIGAATGARRAVVFGVTAGVGVLAYALNGFAPQIGADWPRVISPYHYYIGGHPLTEGVVAGDAGVLAGAAVVLLAAGAWRFRRRDLAA